jgi:hypothetical protein
MTLLMQVNKSQDTSQGGHETTILRERLPYQLLGACVRAQFTIEGREEDGRIAEAKIKDAQRGLIAILVGQLTTIVVLSPFDQNKQAYWTLFCK